MVMVRIVARFICSRSALLSACLFLTFCKSNDTGWEIDQKLSYDLPVLDSAGVLEIDSLVIKKSNKKNQIRIEELLQLETVYVSGDKSYIHKLIRELQREHFKLLSIESEEISGPVYHFILFDKEKGKVICFYYWLRSYQGERVGVVRGYHIPKNIYFNKSFIPLLGDSL
jgi:hypothetical protein